MVSTQSRRPLVATVALLAALGLTAVGCSTSGSQTKDDSSSATKAQKQEPENAETSEAASAEKNETQENESESTAEKSSDFEVYGPNGEMTDETITRLAWVQIKMKDFAEKQKKKDKPETKEEKKKMMMEAMKKMQEVVKEEGFDKETFGELNKKIQQKPELQKRIQERAKELRADSKGASQPSEE